MPWLQINQDVRNYKFNLQKTVMNIKFNLMVNKYVGIVQEIQMLKESIIKLLNVKNVLLSLNNN